MGDKGKELNKKEDSLKNEKNKGKRIKSRKLYLDNYVDSSDDMEKEELDSKFDDVDVVNDKEQEELIDKELEREDNMSIAVMILILFACFVVGSTVGYFMYRLVIK